MSLLVATGISKSYPGGLALDDVSFELRPGEVHALLGENGAGKSTLIKILSGAVVPDAGSVRLQGVALPPGDPRETWRRGVSVVYEELTLVPELSAAENIFLGRERGGLFLDRQGMASAAQTLLDSLGARVAARAPVRTLSVAQQQMVEIARALAGTAKALILDEPTAALSRAETERLFAAMRDMRARGLGIVYISHRLEEVGEIVDRVTVLRDGRLIATESAERLDRRQLIRLMVGRDLKDEFPARTPGPRAPLLQVRHLSSPPYFEGVSLTVDRGEIVGLAGLVGAGRTPLALALFGALPSQGDVTLEGRAVRLTSPSRALAAGVAYVTEDRKARGLFPLMGADANITMASLESFTRRGLLSLARESAAASDAARTFDLRAARLTQPAATLSGGNQQKLLLARYLLEPRRLLILDEPTRGIDVGAKTEIYALMNRLTAQGLGILMISSELPEVLGMSDRIVVMHEGRMRGELTRAAATPERVMEMATGSAA